MKKYLLSGAVVGSFLLYSLGRRPNVSVQTVIPNSLTTPIPTSSTKTKYKDGTYTGSVSDAFYGNVQVQVSVNNGEISDIKFLQHPTDRERSIQINNMAMPVLRQEVIQSQNANVDTVSGATYTSQAFIQSLSSALNQAH